METAISSAPAAACQLHAKRARLVAVKTLFDGVMATHGGFGLLAVSDGEEQFSGAHGLGLGFPAGEVLRGGVLGAHGGRCGGYS